MATVTPAAGRLLERLGRTVRAIRDSRGLARRELAERSGLSERFLAQIESGRGNVSLGRFAELALALGVAPAELLRQAGRPTGPLVALLGLRGAGKSTIGAALGRALNVPFVELDTSIESEAGLPLSQIFEMHGEVYYRRLEARTLAHLLASLPAAVIATGGGVVTDPRTFEMIRRACTTVWLSARPEDHWNRVVAQGDRRPMAGNPNAMDELRALLADREPLYASADLSVDTSALTIDEAVDRIRVSLEDMREPPVAPADARS